MSAAPCEACNTIPRAVSEGYVEKGEWIEIAGLPTYVTGPAAATKGIVDVYDVFGPASQTLQGADGLATALGAIVLVPDFFKGEKALDEWFTNVTPENDALKNAFFGKVMGAGLGGSVQALKYVVEEAKTKWSGVESWGTFGLCWGGKVTALASTEGTPFKASGQVHPGRLATEDAKAITIPHIVLASKDEDAAIVKEYAEVLVGQGKPNVVETYGTMHHGWMGARAKLNDPENVKEYERGYNALAVFFAKHL